MLRRLALVFLTVALLLPAESQPQVNRLIQPQRAQQPNPSSQGLSLSEVSLDKVSFNPSRNDKLILTYRLSRDAKVSIKVFDPDRQLVRTLATNAVKKAGVNREPWDGRDLDGKVVPNEAYFFTIEAEDSAGGKGVYDPLTFSGGEFGDLTQGQMDRESGTLTYQLSHAARVLLRAGLGSGLLLKTIVDWEPRSAGTITEYWNGKDEDGLFDVPALKGTTMVLTYMTLPETSVITIGNDNTSYRVYKKGLAKPRPTKEDRLTNARKISPHFMKSRLADRAFKANLLFPDLDKAGSKTVLPPTISNTATLRVAVSDADREVLQGQQFEIMVFIDTAFLLEQERGYLPFNFPLEVSTLPPGEHTITINLITFGDQIGVGSRKIKVAR